MPNSLCGKCLLQRFGPKGDSCEVLAKAIVQFVADPTAFVRGTVENLTLQFFAFGDIPFAALDADLAAILIKKGTPCARAPFRLPGFRYQAELGFGITSACV